MCHDSVEKNKCFLVHNERECKNLRDLGTSVKPDWLLALLMSGVAAGHTVQWSISDIELYRLQSRASASSEHE